MFGSTMLLTVGHALDRRRTRTWRARERRRRVGDRPVINSDGHGVAILESSGDLCVVRQDAICLRRGPPLPHRVRLPRERGTSGTAHRHLPRRTGPRRCVSRAPRQRDVDHRAEGLLALREVVSSPVTMWSLTVQIASAWRPYDAASV